MHFDWMLCSVINVMSYYVKTALHYRAYSLVALLACDNNAIGDSPVAHCIHQWRSHWRSCHFCVPRQIPVFSACWCCVWAGSRQSAWMSTSVTSCSEEWSGDWGYIPSWTCSWLAVFSSSWHICSSTIFWMSSVIIVLLSLLAYLAMVPWARNIATNHGLKPTCSVESLYKLCHALPANFDTFCY